MENMYDADLFPVPDVDIFPIMPDDEWIESNILKIDSEPTDAPPNPMVEKSVENKVNVQSKKLSSSDVKKPAGAPKKTSASRVYISDAEQEKPTSKQNRGAVLAPKQQMNGKQLKPEQIFWIIVFVLFVFGAWPIALILFFCKNLVLNKMKTEMKKKGL